MIEFEKIELTELKNIIYLCYQGDDDLVSKYHSINLEPGQYSLDDCVELTYQRLCEAVDEYKADCYLIKYNDDVIGYLACVEDLLYSFAIIKAFRKKEILTLWWEEVVKFFNGSFITMIYNNNQRCLMFLLKNEMKIVGTDNNIILLKNI